MISHCWMGPGSPSRTSNIAQGIQKLSAVLLWPAVHAVPQSENLGAPTPPLLQPAHVTVASCWPFLPISHCSLLPTSLSACPRVGPHQLSSPSVFSLAIPLHTASPRGSFIRHQNDHTQKTGLERSKPSCENQANASFWSANE